jgi:uncharacterized protein YbjT (DUF2867 family)
VAHVLLEHGDYKVRGLTRDPQSSRSQELRRQGIEIIKGDINDPATLIAAFHGADIIFGTTAYSSKALLPGMQQASYELEVQQGKNIAEAAATVETTELFVWSSLSAATRWSKDKYSRILSLRFQIPRN